MTLTMSPMSDETVFEATIQDLPTPETPVGGPMAFVVKATGFGSTTMRIEPKTNDQR